MDLSVLVDTRSKAAAWAWYQRTSGSMAAARPEIAIAAPHRSVRSGPSRFKLEAEYLRLSNPSALQDTSDRLESLHLSTHTSVARTDGPNINTSTGKSPTESSTSTQSNEHPRNGVCLDLVLASPASRYGAAAWDCGSALFDSFELVAMSKKLDHAHQLNHTIIGKVYPPHAAEGAPENNTPFESWMDANEEIEEGERSLVNYMASNAPHELVNHRPPDELSLSVGIHDQRRHSDHDSDTTPFSPFQMQSRQAVYDMFCRYDNAGCHPGSVLSEDAMDHGSHEHTKKLKLPMSPMARSKQHRRRRFLSLSKVVRQHIAQLTGHSRGSSTTHRVRQPPDGKPCHSQSLSLPAETVTKLTRQSQSLGAESTVHRHSHSPKTTQPVSPRRTRIKPMGSPLRECSPPFKSHGSKPSNQPLLKQFSTDSVHHHYHHHYHHHHHHYLFRRHSDEGFTALPEPLLGADKSLLVAVAGLRTAQISSLQDYLSLNPKLEGMLLDHKRKMKDVNAGVVSPILQLSAPSPSPFHPSVQV